MSAPATSAHPGRVSLIAFNAGGQLFVLDVMRVRELVRAMPLVPAPGSPPWLLGHMVLRGEVLPVVHLQMAIEQGLRSQGPARVSDDPPKKSTQIMVVDTGSHSLGLMVDRVSEVVGLAEDALQPDLSPEGLRSPISFGLCPIRGKPHIMLDVRPLLALTDHFAQK
jgi:purine-binding chemotaxis protein CheW